MGRRAPEEGHSLSTRGTILYRQQEGKENPRSILGKRHYEDRRAREQAMSRNDPYDLQRFVEAQSGLYEQVCQELQEGRKRSHWMWFIFPQLKGLGNSAMAERYGISSAAEAEAYLAHAVLGTRLRHCTERVMAVKGRSAEQIFGFPDDLKLRSSMTLFASLEAEGSIFSDALKKYFGGKSDRLTIERL